MYDMNRVKHRRVSPGRSSVPVSDHTFSVGLHSENSQKEKGRRAVGKITVAALLLLLVGGATLVLRFRTGRRTTKLWYTAIGDPLITIAPKKTTPSNSTTSSTCDGSQRGSIWLVGIVRNASADISPSTMKTLVELNSLWNISVHVVAQSGIQECKQHFKRRRNKLCHDASQCFKYSNCAPFHIELEPKFVAKKAHRVDRISAVRDYQRQRLRSLHERTSFRKEDLVVVADMDLYRLPPVDTLMQQIYLFQEAASHQHLDALCATGIMYRPYGYYDIFATVLLPDTFVYPLRGRWMPKHYPGEDPHLVRSNNMYGRFSQWDLLGYLEAESRKISRDHGNKSSGLPPQPITPVPVRSCFGGITIYRASTWFDQRCHYSYHGNVTNSDLMRYASKNSKRPCEHVVFHDCLFKLDGESPSQKRHFSIAIQPALKTEWNERPSWGHTLRPGTRHEALGVFFKHADRADRLIHGQYTLRIHKSGTLQVEHWMNSTAGVDEAFSKTTWKAEPQYAQDVNYWTHMYLILKPSGELQLFKQVPLSLLTELNSSICRSNDDPCVCDERVDNCNIVVWSVNGERKSGTKRPQGSPLLVLDSRGKVSIVDEQQHDAVLWTNGGQASDKT